MQYSKQEGPESAFEFSSVLGLFGRHFVSDFEILILSLFGLRFVSDFVLRISDFEFDLLS